MAFNCWSAVKQHALIDCCCLSFFASTFPNSCIILEEKKTVLMITFCCSFSSSRTVHATAFFPKDNPNAAPSCVRFTPSGLHHGRWAWLYQWGWHEPQVDGSIRSRSRIHFDTAAVKDVLWFVGTQQSTRQSGCRANAGSQNDRSHIAVLSIYISIYTSIYLYVFVLHLLVVHGRMHSTLGLQSVEVIMGLLVQPQPWPQVGQPSCNW